MPRTTSQTPLTPPSSTSPRSRLTQISTHIAPMAATSFDASVVPQAPEDPLFGLMAAYRRDTDSKKVDLGIGAYRDNNAKPWILPVVKKVRATISEPQWLFPRP
jgi:aspartate aminotransferase